MEFIFFQKLWNMEVFANNLNWAVINTAIIHTPCRVVNVYSDYNSRCSYHYVFFTINLAKVEMPKICAQIYGRLLAIGP